MPWDDLREALSAAIARPGGVSSDYDLNAGAPPAAGRPRPAAVLIAVETRPDGPVVHLTKRSSRLRHHPGQIALPGGRTDPDDAGPAATALREAQEEIGLPPSAIDILGHLPIHRTVTGFDVTPVVGWQVAAFDPVPETGEVDEVFAVPFSHVVNLDAYSVQSRRWRGERRYYYTAPWGPYYIWGATARILRGLAERMAP